MSLTETKRFVNVNKYRFNCTRHSDMLFGDSINELQDKIIERAMTAHDIAILGDKLHIYGYGFDVKKMKICVILYKEFLKRGGAVTDRMREAVRMHKIHQDAGMEKAFGR